MCGRPHFTAIRLSIRPNVFLAARFLFFGRPDPNNLVFFVLFVVPLLRSGGIMWSKGCVVKSCVVKSFFFHGSTFSVRPAPPGRVGDRGRRGGHAFDQYVTTDLTSMTSMLAVFGQYVTTDLTSMTSMLPVPPFDHDCYRHLTTI
jgi:hypothetical protein